VVEDWAAAAPALRYSASSVTAKALIFPSATAAQPSSSRMGFPAMNSDLQPNAFLSNVAHSTL
jgi:hypothetical protein